MDEHGICRGDLRHYAVHLETSEQRLASACLRGRMAIPPRGSMRSEQSKTSVSRQAFALWLRVRSRNSHWLVHLASFDVPGSIRFIGMHIGCASTWSQRLAPPVYPSWRCGDSNPSSQRPAPRTNGWRLAKHVNRPSHSATRNYARVAAVPRGHGRQLSVSGTPTTPLTR